MTASILQRLLSLFKTEESQKVQSETESNPKTETEQQAAPDPEFLAGQLRKPEGEFAPKIAAKMDEVNGPLIELTIDTMQLSNGESVLEIGFGSGSFFEKLSNRADDLRVSGIDYSPEMVEKAREGNRSLVDSGNLRLKQADSRNIPFPDNSFDKVFCNMVVYFWDRPEEHLEEVRRVLKPEGLFYTGLRSKESMQKLPFIEHGFNLYDQDRWSAILRENGFRVTGIRDRLDPELEIEGNDMRMESLCIVASVNGG